MTVEIRLVLRRKSLRILLEAFLYGSAFFVLFRQISHTVEWLNFAEQKTLFLKFILKNHDDLKYDKESAKIVEKMQNGKNLKKKRVC